VNCIILSARTRVCVYVLCVCVYVCVIMLLFACGAVLWCVGVMVLGQTDRQTGSYSDWQGVVI